MLSFLCELSILRNEVSVGQNRPPFSSPSSSPIFLAYSYCGPVDKFGEHDKVAALKAS